MIPVLWVTQVYPRETGDVLGGFLHRLARELPPRGFDVRVVAPAADGFPDEDEMDGVRITRFRYARTGEHDLAYTGEMHRVALRSPLRFLRFLKSFERAIERAVDAAPPALVHAHWWIPGGRAVTAVAARHAVPFVVSLHGTDVRLLRRVPLARFAARRVMRAARRVLPVSSALAAEVAGLTDRPVDVLPMPADADVFRPAAEPTGSVSFVVACRLTKQKRVDDAIAAFADARRSMEGARLHVAGDGTERDRLERLARSLDAADAITFHGALPAEELATLFGGARAVLLPSEGEGYGLTLVEAALCGVAGIGARSGGIVDIVTPETGRLVPVGDRAALAAALVELGKDAALARRLGERARERAQERTAPALADRLVEVYREEAAGRAS